MNKTGRGYVALLIAAFSFYSYFALKNPDVTTHNVIWHSLMPFLAFFVGRLIGGKVNQERVFVFWIFIMMVALALDSIPITILDIIQHGLVNPERHLHVFDNPDMQRATTSRTMDMTMAVAGICCAFFMNNDNSKINRWFVIFSIIGLLCNAHYLSRTGFVLFIISLTIGVYFGKKNTKLALFLLIMLIGFYFISETDLFKAYSAREREGSSFEDVGGRTIKWSRGWEALLANPHGYTRESYSHNYWLDFGREGGIEAAIFLFVFCFLF